MNVFEIEKELTTLDRFINTDNCDPDSILIGVSSGYVSTINSSNFFIEKDKDGEILFKDFKKFLSILEDEAELFVVTTTTEYYVDSISVEISINDDVNNDDNILFSIKVNLL